MHSKAEKLCHSRNCQCWAFVDKQNTHIALYVKSSNAADQVVLKGVDRDTERFSHW